MPLVLIISLLDIHQRHVLVSITGIGVLLAMTHEHVVLVFCKLDCLLWTVLYAGKTKLTVTFCLYALSSQEVIATRSR